MIACSMLRGFASATRLSRKHPWWMAALTSAAFSFGCSASPGSSEAATAVTTQGPVATSAISALLPPTGQTPSVQSPVTEEEPILGVPEASGGPGVGGADIWPSPACVGGAINAVTGQYCQGAAFDPAAPMETLHSDSGCGSTLWGVARDFVGYMQTSTAPAGAPHPDFGSHYCCGNPLGTVLPTLGADRKPVYNPANLVGDYSNGVGLTGAEAFDQWYRDVPGVNLAYLVGFHLVPTGDGATREFASKLYFPVDGVGFGNLGDYGEDGMSHNFGFTTELHTTFRYQGGEIFRFEGDDDLWVFVNNQLAMDLAGIHSATAGEIKLDEFAVKAGMVVGGVYALDLFNAERHPSGSNFKITTTMGFVDCGVVPSIL
jgi:fibro-slime domain-containing protein